jgi:signal transduction histidine kinase
MRQLFQNLIGNALKFHRAGVPPIVKVQSEERRDLGGALPARAGSRPCCRFTVEDNGIGFADEHRERIFMPFRRLHGPREYEGTGMGLAIVRRIVEQHGGSITARGIPGEGAKFTVMLPLRGPVRDKPGH